MKAVAFALMLAASAVQAESALTNRATDLLAKSESDAAKITSLSENARVDVLRRRGAWSEVKTGTGLAGWVRMMHLTPQADAGTNPRSPNAADSLAKLLGSGRTSNNATVTTGVRGLQEEDLQKARANPNEFRKMQQYAVTKDAAQAFAQRSGLAPIQVDYLESVVPAGAGGDGGNAVPGLIGG